MLASQISSQIHTHPSLWGANIEPLPPGLPHDPRGVEVEAPPRHRWCNSTWPTCIGCDKPIWLVVEPPLWRIWINWDDYSQYMEKQNVPNHQPAIACNSGHNLHKKLNVARSMLKKRDKNAIKRDKNAACAAHFFSMLNQVLNDAACKKKYLPLKAMTEREQHAE